MQVRALYINDAQKPVVNLSATTYLVKDPGSGLNFDSILYQMDYKLPDGYTYVDSGVKAGDNEGISYYQMVTARLGADAKAIYGAIGAGVAVGTSLISGGGLLSSLLDVNDAVNATSTYYEKREDSVLDEMSAETLAKYMYEGKPINVEKYAPIYWEYPTRTNGQSGSLNALIPVGCAQKNNQNHYLYGIAWLRYKDKNGAIQTIYTPALPATVNDIPDYSVTKSGS